MVSNVLSAAFIIDGCNLRNKYFSVSEEQKEEEGVDEPAAERGNEPSDETAADEEDMSMPVPQVKVGPDGQIILDEKSLVRFFFYYIGL
jgi:hypothetical protein